MLRPITGVGSWVCIRCVCVTRWRRKRSAREARVAQQHAPASSSGVPARIRPLREPRQYTSQAAPSRNGGSAACGTLASACARSTSRRNDCAPRRRRSLRTATQQRASRRGRNREHAPRAATQTPVETLLPTLCWPATRANNKSECLPHRDRTRTARTSVPGGAGARSGGLGA